MAVGTTAAIVGGAVAGGLGSAYMAKRSADKAARQAASATKEASRTQLQFLEEQTGLAIEDLEDAFAKAQETLAPLYGDLEFFEMQKELVRDPTKVLQTPAAEFQREEQQRMLENLLSATSGGGLTGAGVRATQELGTNLVSQQIDEALARLAPMAAVELGALETKAGLETGLGQSLAATRTQTALPSAQIIGDIGATQAQLAMARGQSQAQLWSGLGSGLMNVGMLAGTGAFGSPSTFSGTTGVPNMNLGYKMPSVSLGF